VQKVCRERVGLRRKRLGRWLYSFCRRPTGFFQTDHSDQAHTGHTRRCRKTNLPDALEELSLIEQSVHYVRQADIPVPILLALEPWVLDVTMVPGSRRVPSATMSVIAGYIVGDPNWSFLPRVRQPDYTAMLGPRWKSEYFGVCRATSPHHCSH
jgi:hypothetical protein